MGKLGDGWDEVISEFFDDGNDNEFDDDSDDDSDDDE
jgi:hypothetical protein